MTLPQTGQTALIGIASIATSDEQGATQNAGFVPTFLPEHAEWITSKLTMDQDGDGVCDAMDNCPQGKNADQRNSNFVAERAWGSFHTKGIELGDVCDPAATPVPRLSGLAKPKEGLPRQRIVRDRIRVEPVLRVGTVSSDKTVPRFCLCRTPDGKPITKQELCEAPPFHCKANSGLVLNDEGKSTAVLPDTETTWHLMEVSQFATCTLLGGCVGTKFPVSYPSSEYQLGHWNYKADNTRWLASGFFSPVPPTPGYPAGTDLAGVLWMHGLTPVGAETHGVNTGPCIFKPCAPQNIADGYQFGVMPDRRNEVELVALTSLLEIELPVPYCSPCGDDALLAGEYDLDPIPVVSIDPDSGHSVYWLAGGNAFSADEALSPELRAAFVDPTLRWVAPSEPINVVRSSAVPRALALDTTGTRIEADLSRSASGFQLRRSQRDGIAAAALSSSGPAPRAGFGAAFSRVADALFVAGGRLSGGSPAADVWRNHAGGWSSAPLSTTRQPVDVRAACFTARESRLWLLDVEHGPGGKRRWFLYRVAPVTGAVELLKELPFLQPFDTAWLGVTEDGALLLSATKEQTHFIAELQPAATDKLTVARCALGAGRLVKRPDVLYGRVTRAVRSKFAGEPRVFVEHIALGHGPCGLENDL